MLSFHQVSSICFTLFIGCVTACQTGPRLRPRVEGWADRQAWLDAPIILVGSVTAVRGLSETPLQVSDWPADVALERVQVRPERFLRGREGGAEVVFYRYGLLRGQLPGDVPTDSFQVGERRIFFLVRENGVLRTRVDIVASSFRVFSGTHPGPKSESPLGMSRSIAEILVLPGASFDEDGYVKSLGVQTDRTIPLLVGFKGTAQLLRIVIAYPNKRLAAEACIALYTLSPFGDECAGTLLAEAKLPGTVRQKIEETVRTYGSRVALETERFKKRPVDWFTERVLAGTLLGFDGPAPKDDAQFLLDELKKHPDPSVRRNAELLLRDYLPKI